MHKQKEIQKTGRSISIASEPIKEVTEAKFLGVWFDPYGTFILETYVISLYHPLPS